MPLVWTIGLWCAALAAGVGTLYMAILAGRSRHTSQIIPLIGLEMLCGGAALVLLIFEGWFAAKTLIGIGLAASGALILAIAIVLASVVPAVLVSYRVVRAGYGLFGKRSAFASDFANSVWLTRGSVFRPKDFSERS